MLRYLRSLFGGSPVTATALARTAGAARPVLRGRYDAAQTNDANRRHWAFADGMSADAAANPDVRRILRNRARYECANNAIARGMVETLANDTIGTGPRLQMLVEGNPAANAAVEQAFSAWCKAVNLPEKLRTMRSARVDSGETFALLTFNPGLANPVKLDVRLIEADQVATPDRFLFDSTSVDGIVFDRFGNPTHYHILKSHPGADDAAYQYGQVYDTVAARSVIHYFRATRPGQSRGIPDLTPALPLFAQLRRFTLATIAAAETAANFAGILYTDAPPNGEADEVEPMDGIELDANALTTMPAGWKMGQMTAEHPATTHAEFKRAIITEAARCVLMPYNIAAGDSSGYNYASGRMDHQVYYKSIRVEQESIGRNVLDRIFAEWLAEAVLISGLIPARFRSVLATTTVPPHIWFFDGTEHVDPAKEATAQQTRLASNTTTLAAEYAKQGKDWEPEVRQRAKEINLLRELGITPEQAAPPANTKPELDPEEIAEELQNAA